MPPMCYLLMKSRLNMTRRCERVTIQDYKVGNYARAGPGCGVQALELFAV